MSKTSLVDEYIQQFETLPLEQLLELKEKVDALIEKKALESALYEPLSPKSRAKLPYPDWRSVIIVGQPGAGKSTLVRSLLGYREDSPLENVAAEDETLEDAIKLVDEWMSDESGYDEETYPQIEAALNQNQVSL